MKPPQLTQAVDLLPGGGAEYCLCGVLYSYTYKDGKPVLKRIGKGRLRHRQWCGLKNIKERVH